jgi:hypothetical protein
VPKIESLQLLDSQPQRLRQLDSVVLAQFIGHNYEEAMRLARIAIRLRGDYAGAHRVLTAAAGMAGQIEVAMAALQELRRAQPNISLAWIVNQVPIKQDAAGRSKSRASAICDRL